MIIGFPRPRMMKRRKRLNLIMTTTMMTKEFIGPLLKIGQLSGTEMNTEIGLIQSLFNKNPRRSLQKNLNQILRSTMMMKEIFGLFQRMDQ